MLTLILSAGMLPVVTAEVPLDELSRAPVQGQHSGFPYLLGRACPAPSMVSMHRQMNTQSLYSNSAHTWHRWAWRCIEANSSQLIIATGLSLLSPLSADGSMKKQTSRGRPVDVINLPDGSILVSDDYADAIYRITYN